MKILDRYIILRWIKSLFRAILAATVIYLVVDLVDNLASFIDAAPSVGTVVLYYLYYIPSIIYLTMPVSSLLATLFTVGGMTQTNELMAMQASGVPFRRMLSLLLVTAFAVAFGNYYLGESVVPLTNRLRNDIQRYDIKRAPRESAAHLGRLYLQVGESRQLYIDMYNAVTKEAYRVEMIDVEQGRLVRHIRAEKIVWRSGCWRFQGAVDQWYRPNDGMTFARSDSITLAGTDLSPAELENIQTQPQEMNRAELKEFIERLRLAGSLTLKWEVERLSKVALPAAAMIIVLFGAPLAAIRRRGGTALGFGLALFVCFIYFAFMEIGKTMGNNGTVIPVIAVWMSNGFFGLLGLASLAYSRH